MRFSLAFYRRNLVFFPRNLTWNSFYIVKKKKKQKQKFISLPVKFPADRSKFQFCTTARSIISFAGTVLPCLSLYFSKSRGRNNAKYAFQYTSKNKATRYAKKKKKRKNKVGTFIDCKTVGFFLKISKRNR